MKRSPLSLACVAILLLLTGATAGEARADVLGYWPLDGHTRDVTRQLPDGVLSGGGGYVAGALGQGLDFLSATGQVGTGLTLADGQKSVVFYAKTNNYTTQTVWLGNGAPTSNRFFIGSQSDKAFLAGGGTWGTPAWTSMTTGVFHHYALVELGGGSKQIAAYQDGQYLGVFTYTGSTATSAGQQFLIGRAGGAGNVDARAVLDDVAVFDNSLTSNAIGFIATRGVQAYLNSMSGKLLYRETFPHNGQPYVNRTLPAEGWRAHYSGGSESGSTEIAREEGSRARAPLNSSPTQDDLLHGYVHRSNAGAGMDYLYWTDEYTIANVDDVHLIRWDQRNNSDSDVFQVALRLDTGTPGDPSDDQWYASLDTFANLTAQEAYTNGQLAIWRTNRLLMAEASWQLLSFVPNGALELVAGQVALPSGVAVTAFGLYTPSVIDAQRFDNFEIHGVPEPAAMALLASGILLSLLLRRRF